MMEELFEEINILPESNDLWDGIGGHFSTLSQVIEELIDNSVSNFQSNVNLNHRSVFIHFEDLGDFVNVKLEDTGSGIENFKSAFKLGDRSSGTSALNEHGFGLKHALASANPENNGWNVYTRTKDEITSNKVKKVKAPYKFEKFGVYILDFNQINFPSQINNQSTGTIVEFKVTKHFFKSMGRHGAKDSMTVISHLVEDLGFVYCNLIKKVLVNITVQLDDYDRLQVETVEPILRAKLKEGEGVERVDLGLMGGGDRTGEVAIEYKFMTIDKREQTQLHRIRPVHYVASQKTQGVEVRINGRMIENNILWDVWGVEKHNSYNNFLVQINLIHVNSKSLPTTRSSKNGFRREDIKLIGLFNWIRKKCPEPYENKYDRKESSLVEDLANKYENTLLGRVSGNLEVIRYEKLFIDSDEIISVHLRLSFLNNFTIFETKKSKSKVNDLYNLKLYWDSYVMEGKQPTEAILLSTEHTSLTHDLVFHNNNLKDANGSNYNFILKTWKDEGIKYPPDEEN